MKLNINHTYVSKVTAFYDFATMDFKLSGDNRITLETSYSFRFLTILILLSTHVESASFQFQFSSCRVVQANTCYLNQNEK